MSQKTEARQAAQAIQNSLEFARAYIDAKHDDTPQAAAAWNDLLATVSECALEHWQMLLTGNFAGYAQAILTCVIRKLLTQ